MFAGIFPWVCESKQPRGMSALRAATLALVAWLLLAVGVGAQAQLQIQLCPNHMDISPCSCEVKKSGLDLLCEFTNLQNITRTMSALKSKPSSTVIFYLRLRHNNLPKLQGFVFLGLDIRHLTIHNSSLGVVEESSLSSIGNVYLPPPFPLPTPLAMLSHIIDY